MSKKNKGIIKFFTGLIIGIGIGLAIDNLGVWTAIGIALGAGLSQSKIAWIFLHCKLESESSPLNRNKSNKLKPI